MTVIPPFFQTVPSSEVLVEAVEQQDLDAVQILLYQFSVDEVDLNTPDSRGLTPLDIAIMTNNVPIAKLLLKAGAKESPHCESSRVLQFVPSLSTSSLVAGMPVSAPPPGSSQPDRCVAVVSVESREAHLDMLLMEAEHRAADLAAQAQRDGLSTEACLKDERLQAWEGRATLYKQMRAGFQHARE